MAPTGPRLAMNSKHKVMIVEDSESLAEILSTYLAEKVYEIKVSTNLKEARQVWKSFKPDIILLDLELPDGNGMELLSDPLLDTSKLDVIVMTAFGSNAIAARALRSGAMDYLSKPFDADRLNTTLRNLLERRALSTQVARYAQMDRQSYCGLIGSSLPMQAVYRIIDSVAPSKATAFIVGESGTGKELAASAIHQMSGRTGAFHAINCGAIPNELMESAIFGHVKGAFTGASSSRDGAASFAKNGTLFLDEICEMDLVLQKKMLRFLQTGELQRVGSNVTELVDVRFICATNRNPLEEVRAGRFREDLYYRLHVIPIELPPLRERAQDILILANKFLQTCKEKENKGFESFSDEAESNLLSYPWPGNVRELQNVIQNAIILNYGNVITGTMLSFEKCQAHYSPRTELENTAPETPEVTAHKKGIEPLWIVERRVIEHAISTCAGSIHEAASLLEIAPSTIYRKRQSWNSKADLNVGET
jgi:two-component system repressor protein LuxO